MTTFFLKKSLLIFLAVIIALLNSSTLYSQISPVSDTHISSINNLFSQRGITQGHAEIDRYGRIILKGGYQNEEQVDLAFALAQSVVGPKWVSPVTPENIQVTQFAKRLSRILERGRVIQPAMSPPGGTQPPPVRNKYALVVGIGNFQNIPPEKFLRFAARDATGFYQFLIDPQRGAFPTDNVIFLIDSQATKTNIANALEKLKNIAGPDDLVCVFISSHGAPLDKNGEVRIVAYDSVYQPVKVWETSVSLKEFVQGVRAQRLVIMTDACYSSGVYKDIPGFLPSGGKSLGLLDRDEGHAISKDFGKKLLGAKDVVFEDSPKEPQRGLSLPNGWGKVLIAASGENERSWEDQSVGHGYFTYYYLEGLTRCRGAVEDAFLYAKPLVTQRVQREKQGNRQTPQAMATNADWNIPLISKR